MSPSTEPSMLARERLAAAIAGPDEGIDLARASFAIALVRYPDLDEAGCVERLDGLAEGAACHLTNRDNPYQVAADLSGFLAETEGFRGNEGDYHNPDNSFLNRVLERRTGIPITLATVWMEVGQRVGVPLEGVGLPGHFVVRMPEPHSDIILDPYNGGAVMSPQDCVQLVHTLTEGRLAFQDHFLAAVTKRQMLARMLNNLKGTFLSRERYPEALEIVELLLTISPWALGEIRDRGMLRAHEGQLPEALADLETYLQYSPDAEDEDVVRHNIANLRRALDRA